MPLPWSDIEIELIVHDYFNMLKDELSGRPVNKAAHRKALLPLLNNRSEGSVEFKHQNISAVLINLGQPYIKGYLPRYNYQGSLEDFVVEYLTNDLKIEEAFKQFSVKEVRNPDIDFYKKKFVVDPPLIQDLREPVVPFSRKPVKTNYLEMEQNNTILGRSGEKLVLRHERWSLVNSGHERLAEKVEWISRDQGDGAGFDILSRHFDGSDKYIEVKTTKLGKETPFFFTRNELQFSMEHKERYNLYRLFDFEYDPRLFMKKGDLNTVCRSYPVVYRGYF